MLTIFSIPKGFNGHIGVIQKNAIKSWCGLNDCQVVLFGEEENLESVAKELGVQHERDIERNEFGTPMISDAFDKIVQLAKYPFIVYVNSDIIFTNQLVEAVNHMASLNHEMWLMVGQRYDINYKELLDFSSGWEERVYSDVKNCANLHGKAGIDYFVFPKNFPVKLPSMAVGRPGWDSWLIYQTRQLDIPLIDATASVTAVHQNHPPAYKSYGKEAVNNRNSGGGFQNMGTLRDANYLLVREENNYKLSKRYSAIFYSNRLARGLLALKRRVQSLVSE